MDAPAKLHPTDQTLSSFGLGKLDDAAAESVGKHLENCPQCRKRVAEMPDDSFLGRFRGAQQGGKSISVRSEPGGPQSAVDTSAPPTPSASTLLKCLADQTTYEIKRELGRGGMGVVYLAHNKLMGRDEVLKVVGSHLLTRKGVLDRFLREIRSAAKLHHTNIVTAYSALPLGESLALSMEYVAGYDLAQLVSAKGPLAVPQACNFVYQAALGLQHAHERGMVHRDIKPSNLMVAREGNKPVIKVLDFGLAKVTSEGLTERGLTHEGQMLGTPDYIAPEQIRDARSADIRADIYSLGCTLCYVLTGGPPFPGESLYDTLQAHHSMDAEPLNLARPEVPVELAALVAKMMAKEPAMRFQTPGEVAQVLLPFFKPGANPGFGPSPEISRVGQAAPSPQRVGGRPAPAQPATFGTAPAPAPRDPLNPNRDGVAWESLIDFKEAEPLITAVKPKPKVAPTSTPVRRPPWIWAAIAAGVLLLGLVAAWAGGLLKVGTPNGVIVIEGLSDDDIVEVDRQRIPNITIRKTPNGEPFLTLTAETHGIRVTTKDGIEIFSDDIIVEANGSKPIHVSVEPRVTRRARNKVPDGSAVTTENDREFQAPQLPNATARPANGLLAEFFKGEKFERKLKARVDANIDYLWGYDAPDPEVPKDNFSARWTGWLKAPRPGRYKIIAVADDGVRLWLDGKLLIDEWHGGWPARYAIELDLTGKPQALKLDYFEIRASAVMSLRWEQAGRFQERAISSDALFLDELTAERTAVSLPDGSPSGKECGLEVAFFEGIDFGRKLKTRVDTKVDWLWCWDAPDPEVPKNYSARWTGLLKAPQPGLYRLIVDCTDGARLWLDGNLVIDAWYGQPQGCYTAAVDLTGKAQPLKLEHFQVAGGGIISLRWQKYGGFREEPIPATAFFHERDAMAREASLPITTTSETTSSRAIKSPAEAPPGKPPAPPAADAVKTSARALPGKTPATRRRGGGTGKADIAAPFRVATNGLADRQFIDPLSSWPDPHAFNRPDTMERWATPNDFAQLTTRAALVYPTLPVSRYVCEVEVTSGASGGMKFSLGDAENACQICLDWIPERKIIRCWLAHWYAPTWYFGGERTFDPNRRLSLKLVVGDGRQTLFHENKPVLSNACWPVDCRLTILSEAPDSAVVHRCSLRRLTAEDVAACGWSTPPTELRLKPGEAAARLAKISEGYPAKPKPGERFAVKTTGTPMVWIPPGEFLMGIANWSNNPLEMPRHRVKLTSGYWMGQTELTQGEFSKVTGANPSRVTGSPYLPVDWVARDQAMAYCRKLTALEYKERRLPRGYEYRLPTEAEWEYAARAGSDPDFSVPQNLVWSRETSGWRPHEVAESKPNNWRLYDMHGNVMEWCFDAWYEVPKGAADVTVNPFKIGNPDEDAFVVRGGAWWSAPAMCSSHWRARNHNNANGFRGFRIVLGPQIRDLEIEN
jgi:serine/threonine protein kinase/formylglycine-generating enzyme required for sulfatase activity